MNRVFRPRARQRALSGDVTPFDLRLSALEQSYLRTTDRFESMADRYLALVRLFDEALLAADEALYFLQDRHHKCRRVRWEKGNGWFSVRPFVAAWRRHGKVDSFIRVKKGYAANNLPAKYLRPDVRDQVRDLLVQVELIMEARRSVTDALRVVLGKLTTTEQKYADIAAGLSRLAKAITADERSRRADTKDENEARVLAELGLSAEPEDADLTLDDDDEFLGGA